jgi:pimeloyl-ACP methyl ester carboxylesterase
MTRRSRILLRIAGAAVAVGTAVYVMAILDMDRERRARAYLDGRLYAEVRGAGEPVVFLAGLQGSTRYWDHAFDGLSASRRLIFVDALGFGRSPWPKGSRYALDDQLGALRRTLVALGATRNVTLVGYSFGAVIAAYYAARYPAEVRRVILLGAPVWNSDAEARERMNEMSSLGWTFTANRPLALATCTTMCAFRPLLRRVLPLLDRRRPPEVVADSVLHELGAVDGAVDILRHHSIAIPARALGARVTFVHGRRDRVTPLAEVERLARESGARVIVVDADHGQYLRYATLISSIQ